MSQQEERRRFGKWNRRQSDRAVAAPEPSGISGPRQPGYRVRIVYTEPEFRLRNPHCPQEYSFTKDCPDAKSSVDAVRKAMNYFEFCTENSWVGWRRIIKSVTVEPR